MLIVVIFIKPKFGINKINQLMYKQKNDKLTQWNIIYQSKAIKY